MAWTAYIFLSTRGVNVRKRDILSPRWTATSNDRDREQAREKKRIGEREMPWSLGFRKEVVKSVENYESRDMHQRAGGVKMAEDGRDGARTGREEEGTETSDFGSRQDSPCGTGGRRRGGRGSASLVHRRGARRSGLPQPEEKGRVSNDVAALREEYTDEGGEGGRRKL